MKFLEVLGITGGIVVIVFFAAIIGLAVLYYLATKDGQNPFQ